MSYAPFKYTGRKNPGISILREITGKRDIERREFEQEIWDTGDKGYGVFGDMAYADPYRIYLRQANFSRFAL